MGANPRSDIENNRLPFAAIPHAVYKDRGLIPGDRDLLARLIFYARSKSYCWPSNRTLARDLGVTTRTVKYRLRRLEGVGWVASVMTEK